jgi:hypothetical protein
MQQKIKFTTEEVERACVPIIGDGEALDLIVGNLHRVGKSEKCGVDENDIVVFNGSGEDVFFLNDDGTKTEEKVSNNMSLKVITIDATQITCKSANGVLAKFVEAQLNHASYLQQCEYAHVQIAAIRHTIAPLFNYFNMKMMLKNVKDTDTKEDLLGLIEKEGEIATKMVERIKHLW